MGMTGRRSSIILHQAPHSWFFLFVRNMLFFTKQKGLIMKLYSFIIFLMVIGCSDQGREVTYLQSEEYEKNNFPFSEAVRYGDILYLSGQVGSISDDMNVLVEGGIGPETKQTMTNIKATLEKYGATMDDVIKCTCMLADIEDWGLMSEEYIKFFPNHKPARSTFAGSGLALGARVEIECMAKIR